jgi:hypothetical protein
MLFHVTTPLNKEGGLYKNTFLLINKEKAGSLKRFSWTSTAGFTLYG